MEEISTRVIKAIQDRKELLKELQTKLDEVRKATADIRALMRSLVSEEDRSDDDDVQRKEVQAVAEDDDEEEDTEEGPGVATDDDDDDDDEEGPVAAPSQKFEISLRQAVLQILAKGPYDIAGIRRALRDVRPGTKDNQVEVIAYQMKRAGVLTKNGPNFSLAKNPEPDPKPRPTMPPTPVSLIGGGSSGSKLPLATSAAERYARR